MTRRAPASMGLVALLLPAALAAQEQAPVLTESLEITVANVEVVVTGPDGNRVRGLTREDFEVWENGAARRISNFAEIGAPQTASVPTALADEASQPATAGGVGDVPPRRVVIVVDLLTTDMFKRRRVLAAVAPLLDSLHAPDEVMVVTWNGSMEIVVEPTSGMAAAREELARLGREASLSRAARLRLDQGTAPTWRRTAVQMAANDLKRSVYALRGLLTRLARVGGRKIVILISEGFQMQPGRELLTVENPFDLDVPAGSIPEPDGSLGQRNDTALFEMESGEGPDLIRSLARTANAAGVTLYTLHGGGLDATAGVDHLSIPSEYYLPRPDMPNQREPDLNRPMTSDMNEIVRERIRGSVEGLTELAERSGGLVAKNTNDYRAAFREIAADLSSYYSLGYRVSGALGERRIEVRMRDPRLTARARQSIAVRSSEEEIADAVLANLAFPRSANDLGIRGDAARSESAGRRHVSIPVDVHVPLERLSFVQTGDAFVATIAIYVAAADARGFASAVRRFEQPVRVAASDFEKIGGAHFTYRMTVDLESRSRENRISIAVLDRISNMTGFAVVDAGTAP